MHTGLKQFLMYASLLAFVGASACSTIEASYGGGEGDGASSQQASGDQLKQMARDSEAGGD